MPGFTKLSHTSLSVPDMEASAEWYGRILGLTEIDRGHGDGWKSILLIHPSSSWIIEFQQHDTSAGETFDPVRTGLDHIGLMVDSRAALDEWETHFEQAGVTHSPIADREYGSVLCFKDPNGIQLEMFYREGHP
jgi:glyoxylase I family protein